LRKHKNGNANANKRKNAHAYTKTSKMPRHNVKNNYGEKLKHSRCNVPSEIQVESSPHETGKLMSNKKRFTMKFKRGFIKHVCIVKLDKLLNMLAKNLKFNKSNKTMGILHDKNKLRETILLIKDVFTLDHNTMKSNATAS
jgi:hypothetical protein